MFNESSFEAICELICFILWQKFVSLCHLLNCMVKVFNVKLKYHGVTFGFNDAIINIFRALTCFKPNGDEKLRYIFRDE